MANLTRADDELLLDLLTLYKRGYTYRQIARIFNLPRNVIASRVAKVCEADILHEPAPARRYWRRT
jgi:DNA-directed RNA polymerase specialized sigma24 family protein